MVAKPGWANINVLDLLDRHFNNPGSDPDSHKNTFHIHKTQGPSLMGPGPGICILIIYQVSPHPIYLSAASKVALRFMCRLYSYIYVSFNVVHVDTIPSGLYLT